MLHVLLCVAVYVIFSNRVYYQLIMLAANQLNLLKDNDYMFLFLDWEETNTAMARSTRQLGVKFGERYFRSKCRLSRTFVRARIE